MKLTAEQQTKLRELLSQEWKRKDGSPDNRMVDYCIKSSKYIVIGNTFIDVCNSKPTIKKTIWYDDTQTDPGSSYESFIFANRYNMPRELELTKYCESLRLSPKYGNRQNIELCGLTYNDNDSDRQREVTPEELKIINAAINEVKADYTKRLEAYYKKYSNKIYSMGYWADR
jgi:hypothetical protein